MRTSATFMGVLALLWAAMATPADAQKGMGDPTGMARQAVKPDVVSLSGKVLGVESGPCEMSTGRSSIGTHFLLETPKDGKLNVHLGPAGAVAHIADQLAVGREVSVEAFRTEKMPENHYVAKSLALDGKTIQLRDETLRPFWLAAGPLPRGRGVLQSEPGKAQDPAWGPGPGYGFGARRGYGPGYGRGPGRRYCPGYGGAPAWGRAWGYGRGAGWRAGRGYGRGYGPAAGRGAGFGRGRPFVDENDDGICDYYQRWWQQD